MNEIKCPHCGKPIDIDIVLSKDIEKRILAEDHKSTRRKLLRSNSRHGICQRTT